MSDELRDAARQWTMKAESDWTAVEILRGNDQCPADIVCFHCQQYVEKMMKGLLTLKGIEAPRTHDLRRLIQISAEFAPDLIALADRADELSAHGVQSRYPDDWHEISQTEMCEMIELAERFAEILAPVWSD